MGKKKGDSWWNKDEYQNKEVFQPEINGVMKQSCILHIISTGAVPAMLGVCLSVLPHFPYNLAEMSYIFAICKWPGEKEGVFCFSPIHKQTGKKKIWNQKVMMVSKLSMLT